MESKWFGRKREDTRKCKVTKVTVNQQNFRALEVMHFGTLCCVYVCVYILYKSIKEIDFLYLTFGLDWKLSYSVYIPTVCNTYVLFFDSILFILLN